MIHHIKTSIIFYFKLWWAKRQRESLLNDVQAQIRNAKTDNERDEIWASNDWDVQLAQQGVQSLQTRYYGDIARRKGIPTPQGKEDWERLISTQDIRILTVESIAKLRGAIRQHHKELRDVVLPYLAIIISVGALIVAFLNYHKPVTAPQSINQPAQQIASPTPASTLTPAHSTKSNQHIKPHQSKTNKADH